jgi:hypothetical protein
MKSTGFFVAFAIALIAAASLVSPSHGQCTNLLTNPGFEDGGGSYDGWFTFGSGPNISLPGDDDIARSGIAAAKLFGEFTNCPAPVFDVGGFGQAFTPMVGMVYELSGYAFVSLEDQIPGTTTCNDNRVLAQVAFFDAPEAGGVISRNEIVIADYSTIPNQWNDFSVSIPAPTGAQRVEALFLFLQPGCDTGSVYIDDVTFCVKSPQAGLAAFNLLTNPSFDSGLDGWTSAGNAFPDSRVFATRTPIGSAKLFGTFSPGDDSVLFQRVPATPGEDYRFDLYAMTSCEETPINEGNDNVLRAQLRFLGSGDVELALVDSVVVDSTSIEGNWAKYSLDGTAPTGTLNIEVILVFTQTDNQLNGSAWVDDLALYNVTAATGVRPDQTPSIVKLHQNVPNPFNPTTTITFTLPVTQQARVEVFDAAGRSVRVLFDGMGIPGINNVSWDGTNASGNKVASGAYFYKLTSGSFQETRKMVLLK